MPQGAAAKRPPWIYQREAVMRRLQERGLPVPRQDLEFPNKHRYGRVLRAAERIGFPVVLKRPVSGEAHDALPTSGVVGPIHDADQLERAFTRCFEPTSPVWVESYVPGTTYRFLVMDSEPVSVVRLRAPAVVGDGQRDVRLLAAARAAASLSLRERWAWTRLTSHPATAGRLALNLSLIHI